MNKKLILMALAVAMAEGTYTVVAVAHNGLGTATVTSPEKVTAFPREIYIDYMDRSPSDTIVITRDNIGQYFPKVAWMDVDYEHGFQPSN